MVKIEGKYKEIMDKTEWVAIATCAENGPHVVATWGDYVRALDTKDNEVIVVPAGHYNITEENLKKNNRVELLIASRQVEGTYGPGQGCCISGTGEVQTSGKFAQMAKSKFSWARGALVIKVKEVNIQL
jgi:predicted pyridoxine 5'-phosphate oxidase superfamily flavin-nucleotide-binding protein